MYATYRQLHPPTGIEHAVCCNFFSANEKNLVIAGTTQLHVYRLNPDIESKAHDKNTDGKSKKKKLENLGSYNLFGNVMSMQKVSLSGSPRDALLLSFRDAKLSLLEYDPSTHGLKTSSLHYFEQEELKDGCLQQGSNLPIIRVDPDGRCAIMLIYGTRLVVLPFRKDTSADELEAVGTGKSSVLSSYIIDVRKLDEKITNVIDIQFLHGYFEPTLFILCEPLRTWPGRIAVRKDTCSIVAISLNIQEKVHPIIWSLGNLPFDCQQTLPVPKPIGGVLIFSVNALLYLNQSVPPYGVSLNSQADFSSDFLLKPQEGVKINLDGCQASFIEGDRLVMSLRGGELYVLTLMVDGMRCVRSFNFDKAAASVLTTCMCLCEDGYLFLGSRLGNSLLLKYTEKDVAKQPAIEDGKKTSEPPVKKKRLDTMGDWMASDVSAIDDLDELEVYGTIEVQNQGTQITAYTFEVCDSVMNIGPCGQIVMGEPAFLSEEFSNTSDPDLELVTTSGYSKNGALSVLQRSIRPQVVTTFELPGCFDMWTVIGKQVEETEKDQESGEKNSQKSHAFLILSREDSTMILQTGQEIMELDHSGFSTQGPTVYAGNIGNDKYILQVSPMGIRLLEGVNQLQHIPLDMGSAIVHCSVADPYIIIMSAEGAIMLITLRPDSTGSGARLAVMRPTIPMGSQALTVTTYKDVSGMFSTSADEFMPPAPEPKTPKLDTSVFSLDKSSVDDEDELLYGDSEPSGKSSQESQEETKQSQSDTGDDSNQEKKPTYWAVIARESGTLEIYALPDFKLCFLVKNFPVAHKLLVDSGQSIPESNKSSDKSQQLTEMGVVKELLLVGLGNKKSRPYLMARVDEELLVYEVFKYFSSVADKHLNIRFRKVQHDLILKEKKMSKKRQAETIPETGANDHVALLRPFYDVSGYSGVFVCGPYPHWIFMTARGSMRFHPMGIDGSVTCFAPFHNVNCPNGFLYFNKSGELRISVLPTHLSYDAPWPVRKVPLRCTPHFVAYHPESKTYGVVTSYPEVMKKVMRIQGDEKEAETIERDERFIYPTMPRFSVQLFSPVSWEAIPNTKIDLEEWEHVTCLRTVNLKSEGTASGLKGYIVLGTNLCYGEEISSKGRIMIFDVIEVVPEPGQPLTKNKIKTVYDKEQKGPVSALCDTNGFLVTAMGQKIYIWTLKDNDLIGVAFIDVQVYIHTVTSIKNLILVADLTKSVSLLRYEDRVLSLVSRDVRHSEVYSCEFMVDNTQLSFISSDRLSNILLLSYMPEARESHGGQRLLRKADFNAGARINTFFRIRCKLSDPSTDKRATGAIEKKHVTFLATLDGAIAYLLPIPEKVYRRLLMLQNLLNIQLSHLAGLNPKAFRQVQSEFPSLSNPCKNILDGDLVVKYLHLSVLERSEIAKRIGTTQDQIFEDLIEMDRTAAHF